MPPATTTHPACTTHEDGMCLPQRLHLKKRSHTQKSHPKMMNPRDVVENAEEEEEAMANTSHFNAKPHYTPSVVSPYAARAGFTEHIGVASAEHAGLQRGRFLSKLDEESEPAARPTRRQLQVALSPGVA